jgi:hypothetical protein
MLLDERRFFVLEVEKTARWAVGQMLPEKEQSMNTRT